jgi:hypothetical protein
MANGWRVGLVPDAATQAGGQRSPATRLALSRAEAATALGVSVDFFDNHLAPEIRAVRRGRRRLYPVRELERWLERAANLALEDP